MTDLEDRLRSLGDQLDLAGGPAGSDDGAALAAQVVARIEHGESDRALERSVGRRVAMWSRVAAFVVVVVVAIVVAVPSSRRTVAGWFGLDGASVERRPDLVVPGTADPLRGDDAGTIVTVDGREVLVSVFAGTLDGGGLTKTLGDGSNVRPVDVAGSPGLWIDGDPHELTYRAAGGGVVFERVAGDTLLWQVGTTIRRLEGFDDVDAAVAYAESITTP